MSTLAFFCGYFVGTGAALFALALGRASRDTPRPRQDSAQLDMQLAEYAEPPSRWRVN